MANPGPNRQRRQPLGAAALAIVVWLHGATVGATTPTCADPGVSFSPDGLYAIGHAAWADPDGDPESGSSYRFLADGAPIAGGVLGDGLALGFEGTVSGAGGEAPTSQAGVDFAPGRWGSALALTDPGELSFAQAGHLDPGEGTVEMWVAPRLDGSDPLYAARWHCLLLYQTADGDWLGVVQSESSGVIYAGGEVGGQWQSAWSPQASMRGWRAGEWHHVAVAYSAAGGFLRFFLDGVLMADSNEGSYQPPADDGTVFIGGDPWGGTAHYHLDEVRLHPAPLDAPEIAARAGRIDPPHGLEVWLPTAGLAPGAGLAFELTPADASGAGSPCLSLPSTVWGQAITDPRPPSTLLPPGTTALELAVTTVIPTACRWSLGAPVPFAEMAPFDAGGGTTGHHTTLSGLDPDPQTVNHVRVRCEAFAEAALDLRYRSLAAVRPSFPRTGNLWGYWELGGQPLERRAKIDLWLGADMSPVELAELRAANPHVLVLTSINAVENVGLPEDYYLHDVDGQRVEVWPGSFRLNLTRLEVAEHQALFAYERVLASGLLVDGCFFDNVMTSQSWLEHDIYGNPFRPDADGDGLEDDPEVFDAAWRTGVVHEISTFRDLMPGAIVSGHSMDISEPGIDALFNGLSIGFLTADTLEGRMSFYDLWDLYAAWNQRALSPRITMVESSPHDQIAYGYDYSPWAKIPPATLEFARTYHPFVRFGLAFTLMHDGYFAHEFGDTWHGNDWWYDELDHDLGQPFGPARWIALDPSPPVNQIVNGGFETPIEPPWHGWADASSGCVATLERDTADPAAGAFSARVDITATSGVDWHIQLAQAERELVAGAVFDLSLQARADRDRFLTLNVQKGAPDWDGYGLWRRIPIGTEWSEITATFVATATADDASVQILLGEATGTVWLDDVRLTERPPAVLQREFEHGAALLNPTRETRTVPLAPGYARLTGAQAARWEWIADDAGATFTTTGAWQDATLDSGEWQASGPFFHDWGAGCRRSAAADATAEWALVLPEADTYTIAAWWPAAGEAVTWSGAARFEVVAGGAVVASATLDQRLDGDQWHAVATVALDPTLQPFVRLSSGDGDPVIADALHLRSARRFNDGAPAPEVTLQPMDGVVVVWVGPGIPGDADRDGVCTSADLMAIIHAIFGHPTFMDVDVDDSGSVDAADLAFELDAISDGGRR